MPPPVTVIVEVECSGLHGEGYREYAWQKGASNKGGLEATEWNPGTAESEAESSDCEPDAVTDNRDALSEKAVRAACAATSELNRAMKGIREETNTAAIRSLWTEYEIKRLDHSLVLAARWRTEPSTGAVYAKNCHSTTTNITGICSECTSLAKLPGLQQAVRRAPFKAKLPPAEFAAEWARKQKFTPRILSDNSAVDVKNALANPAVVKILSSKAIHGPGGAFLSLYNEAQFGNLDDRESDGVWELVKYEGPWVCAGDGTKLRPLLSTSTEYAEAKSAHVVGSTFPPFQVLFKRAEEQSAIISRIDKAKAIATQVWGLAITVTVLFQLHRV
ncbi:hypothetical protein R3P38DRAFT_3239121 [Favolaschia claudopus]|uniref:Uncharacterized protein n=1 Tax=Favolaschia claudopus TaxID=2862362 RepID=A0AAV9Z8L0_9AGAR